MSGRIARLSAEIKRAAAILESEVVLARESGCTWEQIAAALNGPPRLPGGRSTTSVRDFYAPAVRRAPTNGGSNEYA